jgi:hypothetical protein
MDVERERQEKKKDRCHQMGGACSTHWNHKAHKILIRHSDGKKIHRHVTRGCKNIQKNLEATLKFYMPERSHGVLY